MMFEQRLSNAQSANIENVPCWLLVADIENFTPLSRSLTSDKLAELIGGWVATCKEIIEVHSGMIDKYLGDGFFAYWREDENAAKNVAAALDRLKQAQARQEPHFRLALAFRSRRDWRCAVDGTGKFDGQRRELRFPNGKTRGVARNFAAHQRGGKGKARLASQMRIRRRSRAERLRRKTRIL